MRKLLLITGAGASYDVVDEKKNSSINPKYRPPLTKDLFLSHFDNEGTHSCIMDCMKKHPIAHSRGYSYNMQNGKKAQSLEKSE